ncbi:hypothetical protein CRG98_022654 [Punica granatum]|uniref:Uncharacterized protein n=1 Tax=Punica granatum TaxID=22663 RepID=A0A2I0JM38_PUNGR|nr:hypothetical protein CRG98_022654 [Punica granatum]
MGIVMSDGKSQVKSSTSISQRSEAISSGPVTATASSHSQVRLSILCPCCPICPLALLSTKYQIGRRLGISIRLRSVAGIGLEWAGEAGGSRLIGVSVAGGLMVRGGGEKGTDTAKLGQNARLYMEEKVRTPENRAVVGTCGQSPRM